MSLSDLASIGSLVSGAAVLGSLIYLALQVRQTDRNQQAAIRQGRTTRAIDLLLAQLRSRASPMPGRAGWRRRAKSPQTELRQFLSLCRSQFHHVEDAFYQRHEEGLLNDAAFATVLEGMRGLASAFPAHARPGNAFGAPHTGRFADFMADVVARARLEPPLPSPIDGRLEWRTLPRRRPAPRSDWLGPRVRVWTPLRMQEVFRDVVVREFRCFRVSGLIDAAVHVAAGLYGDRGSGPSRFGALEALGHFTGFPDPVSDRCAIPLV